MGSGNILSQIFFYEIPFWSSIDQAKKILQKNNLFIINEGYIAYEGQIADEDLFIPILPIYEITFEGSFQNESCNVIISFFDKRMISGSYNNFHSLNKSELFEQFRDKLVLEFKIEPEKKHDWLYTWDLPSKLVELIYINNSLSINYYFRIK